MSAINPDRVQAVFLQVVDAPDVTAREAILDRECGVDTELRRRVVELLGAHDRSGSFLDHPVVKPVPLGDTLPPEPRGDSTGKTATTRNDFGASPGAVIAGRFRLLELIGEGGMGTVWRSEQREPVKRLVALKLVKPGMDSQQVLSRFEAERQALALMDHPSIAKVFDGGMTEHGRPYFVMEYVKGIPITTYCDEARLSLKERLVIFTQVCEAVQHAHQKGIIHRDLKPSNILVCLYDGKPVPKVIDFGLAKAIHQPLTEHTLYTAHGLMVGTPLYMSPEQAEFNNLDIDTRSDVYSLGVVLYELLTGTTPLEKQQFKDAALQEVMRLIKEEEPQKPSTKLSGSGSLPSIAAQRSLEPAQLSRAVRGDLDWIVMKSLEKERTRRYETASGLARDIDRYLHDEPVEACPPSATYRLKKLVRRNKGPVAAAFAVLLALVIGVIGTTLGLIEAWHQEGIAHAAAAEERKAREAESKRAEAEAQERKRAEEAEKLAKERLNEVSKEKDRADEYVAISLAVGDFLCNDVLGQADSHRQADRKYIPDPNLTLRTALDRAAERVDRALLGKAKGVEAAVRAAIGNAYYGLGEYNKAIEQLELAVDIYSKGLGPEGANTLLIMNNLSNLYFAVGRTAEGIALAEQVRDNGTKTFGADHPQTYTSANNLAMKYEGVGRVDEAIPILEKGLEASIKALGKDHLSTLILRGNLARAYESAGRPAEAISLAEKSQQAFIKSLGPNDPHTLVATVDLARFYVEDERCVEAIALLERSRESCTKTLGPDHPGTLTALHNLARAYLEAGRTADSLSLMQEVCDARTKQLGARNPDTLNSLQGLAVAYQQAGRTADAIKLLEQVRDAQSASLGPNHPRSLSTKGALAISYDEAGRTDEAIELQKHVLNGYNIMYGLAHPDTITSQVYLADMFEHAGKIGSTIVLLEQMCQYSAKKLGPDDPHTFITQSKLALAYSKCGRTADALKIWDETLPHASAKLPPLSPKLLTIRHGWIESLEQDNQSTKAAELRKQLIADERKAFQQDDAKLGHALTQHGSELLKAQKWEEAEVILRESTAILEKKEPEKWSTFHARSLLGEALMRQEKYADAEPLLRAGYDGLHDRQASLPGASKRFLPDAARRLVKLYQAMGKIDLAQEWRQNFAAVKLPDVATDADPAEITIAAETTKKLPENVLSAADARTLKLLIGKEVEVEGTIIAAEWSSTGKSMQIQFAGDERNPFGLAAVMFGASRAAFDAAFGGDAAGSFVKARIRLRGKLVVYGGFKTELKGASQIVLNDPAQVTILK